MNNTKVTVIADSINESGDRVTTLFEHVCTPGNGTRNLKGWIQYREEIENGKDKFLS